MHAHPLDPLSAEEVTKASALVINKVFPKRGLTAEKKRFISVHLHEPPKEVVYKFKHGDLIDRQVKKFFLKFS